MERLKKKVLLSADAELVAQYEAKIKRLKQQLSPEEIERIEARISEELQNEKDNK